MPVTQTTHVLNDFGLARRDRTTATGTSSRYTVSIEAQPLVATFNAKVLGMGPAQAIAEHYQNRVRGITQDASPSTQLTRKYAAKAFANGKAWAQKRYSGGKTGAKPPDRSSALFNDSGRFADGIVAAPTRDNNWTINVTSNRLDPSTFRDGEAGVARMFDRLRELVPEFGDANRLGEIPEIREAIGDSIDAIFAGALGRSYRSNRDLRDAIRESQSSAIAQALKLVRDLSSIGV